MGGRERSGYIRDFDGEIAFEPVVAVKDMDQLGRIEVDIRSEMIKHFGPPVGRSKEWFNTQDREKVREIILEVAARHLKPSL